MAISHAFTNQVADGTNTSIVRPSDWNSAHNQYYTLSGNTLGASTVSGTNVVFQAAGNVSLSGTGRTIVVYGTNPTVPTSYVSNVNGLSGAISLNAGSSLSASTNGSSITFGLASNITTALQSAGNYLTTQTVQTQASGNIAGTGFTTATTAGTAVVGTLNTAGLNLGIPAYLTTAAGGGGGGVAIGASTQTATSGTVNFANSNGISFGMSGSNQITASYTVPTVPTSYVSNVNGSSGQISLNVGSSLSASTNGSSITFGLASNITTALQSANANYLTSQSNQAFSASGGSSTFQTLNFANSNGVTFSNSGGSIVASYTVPAVPTSYVSNVNGSSGQISLNVGSSLSASTNGSSITFGLASNITTALQSAGAYLTTARASNDAIGLNTAATNVTWTVNSSGLSLNAAGYAGTGTSATNASVTLNSNGLAISVAAPGAANYSIGVSNLGNTAGNTGITGTRIVFVGTNNISLSQATDANGATISIDQTGGGGGGAMYANLSGNTSGNTTASGSTLNFSGINLTLSGTNGSQIAISAPPVSSLVAGTNITISTAGSTISIIGSGGAALSAGTQSVSTGTVNFANSNGISFGMSGSNQITASHNGLTTQSVQTQASGNIAGIGFTTATTAGTAIVGTLDTAGLNLGVPAYLTAAAGGGGMYANLSGNTSGNTTASGSTLNFSGINLTLSGTNGSQIAISAPATSAFIAGNNISFSTTGNTISIRAQAVAIGVDTQTATSGTIVFSNSNGITFGMSGSTRITASYTQSGQAFSASGGSSTFQTLSFANSNGITFSNTNASVRITHDLQYTSNTSAITSNAFPSANTTIFAGTGTSATNASITLNSNGLAISVAAPGGGGGGVAIGADTQTATSGTVVFANSNGISFGMSGSNQITASHNGLTVQSVQTQAAGNIAGTGFTSTTTAGTAITAALGTNGLNMAIPAYLTAAAGGAVNFSAGTTSNNLQTVVFSDGHGVSFGLNGSTITASVAAAGGVIASGYSPHGDYPLVPGFVGQGTLALDPDIFPDLTLNMVAIPINFSANNASTGSFTISNWVGLYSRNVSSISLVHSTSFSTNGTFSGIANSASYYGWRNLTFNWSTSVSGGRYWIGQIIRTTTAGNSACSISQYLASQINTNFGGVFGTSTAATAQLTLGQGFYSASTTALPASIAFTQIQGTNSLAQRFPMVAFGYNSV